ncbi:hypothetical protein SHKM778_04450 [Streptomyces sp. KM77-8]|uniref:ABC transporter ATP-binding protein n=1 Tax=Streptomyces haneummycinicus TaxID=3074435 RepID=A0AAT9H9P0_9ACTN
MKGVHVMNRGARHWRAGFLRGGIELRHLLRNPKEMFGHLSNVAVALLVTYYIGDKVPGTQIPMSHLTLSGFAAYLLFQIGLLSLPQILVTEREEERCCDCAPHPAGYRPTSSPSACWWSSRRWAPSRCSSRPPRC